MNWDYMAGLFDGEGSIGLVQNGGQIKLQAMITTTSHKTVQAVTSFYNENNISHSVFSKPNHYGNSTYITIAAWECIEKFVTRLYPLVVDKKENLEIAKEVFKLRNEIISSDGAKRLNDYLDKFDLLRRRLHALAKKGPKELKPWVKNRVVSHIKGAVTSSYGPRRSKQSYLEKIDGLVIYFSHSNPIAFEENGTAMISASFCDKQTRQRLNLVDDIYGRMEKQRVSHKEFVKSYDSMFERHGLEYV